jgi:hypothetical protein
MFSMAYKILFSKLRYYCYYHSATSPIKLSLDVQIFAVSMVTDLRITQTSENVWVLSH